MSNCREIREALGFTQKQMAQKMNCCHRSIVYWEGTERPLLPVFQKRLDRLARRLTRQMSRTRR